MNTNALLALGLIVIIPAALIGLYLLLNRGKENNEQEKISNSPSKKRKFERLITQFEDLLAQLKGFESRTEQDLSEEYELYVANYLDLKSQAQSGRYDVSKLQEAFDDLEYFYEEYRAPSETARAS